MEKRKPEWKSRMLPNGQSYAELLGFGGEEDYYTVFDAVLALLRPERSSTSVDSLCVSGAFTKDGLTVRMSSEGLTDNLAFTYGGSEQDREIVFSWLQSVAETL